MSKTLPGLLRIGTCSWKYDSWKGLVYSQDVGAGYLSEYAKHYTIVERDQWFWSLFGEKVVMPNPEVVAEYVGSVPKDFRFSIKVPNAITLTHQYGKGSLEANPHFLSNDLMAREVKVTLNVNNHYEGSAPMTIQRFLKLFLEDAFS